MAKTMSNNDIVAYEGGDYGEIMDNYDLHEITAAIANRAGKAADTVRSIEQEIEEMKNNPDVVDILNTYADLQAYDTSKLSDKDIVRVLNDETHNGESTYYRYTKSSNTWTYIGSSKQYTDFVGTDGTTAGAAGLVPAPATADAGKFLKADGTWDIAGGGGPTVVQTTGTSTTDVMSQNATTSMVFADPSTKRKVQLGASASVASGANNGVAVGSGNVSATAGGIAIGNGWNSATVSGNGAIALGSTSSEPVSGQGSISLGAFTPRNATAGVIEVGSTQTAYGYNSSNYRLLTGLYDGQSAHDAATVGQVNSVIDAINTALSTNIPHIGA